MGRFIDWIKRNKLSTLLILISIYLLGKTGFSPFLGYNIAIPNPKNYDSNRQIGSLPMAGGPANESSEDSNYAASQPTNRMVAKNANLSLQVKNVIETLKRIDEYTASIGGYMVDSNLSSPKEAPYGSITIRIPQEKLDEALNQFQSMAVKVVSKQVYSYDITEEYIDIETRLNTLTANQKRFKEIMDQATKPDDILKIQQQIFNLQDQIDKLYGRQKYMEQTAKTAKITVYLSTDEFALPYTGGESFRPEVIFKTAVRSLIQNLQKIAALFIWIIVYTPLILIIIITSILIRKKFFKKQ